MLWFDLVTPKSVLFFKPIIDEIESRKVDDILITTRSGEGYSEVFELLDLYYQQSYYILGSFGGGELEKKLFASLDRQRDLIKFVLKRNVTKLISLSSVDANRVAFGLGIPVVNFYDIPLSDHKSDFKQALPQARLSIPLSSKIFHPYLVPKEIFKRFSLEEDQIFTYQFLDVLIWLKNFQPDREMFNRLLLKYGLDLNKPTILVREEEYKASYVQKKYPILYRALTILKDKVDANFLVIPRYGADTLESEFPFAAVLQEKLQIQHLLAFADLFIGGGGTINCEACYFGTPTISTRSFISHYDKFLIDRGLMQKANTVQEVVDQSLVLLSNRLDSSSVFNYMVMDLPAMVDEILN